MNSEALTSASLDRDRFLDRLLSDALDAEPDDREALIQVGCAGDPFLEQSALQLLAAATNETEWLATRAPVLDVLEDLAQEREPIVKRGDLLGRYRLLEKLGAGGMGTVFLAERADGLYEQQVAIKILRGSAASEVRRRFAREARILARLDHPNIARLLDAGTTPEGLGYLVMEYVDGQPIDEYSRACDLELSARLELVEQTAAAIAFAHRRLILHRDLKPANILVTEAGQVKVLDFGIGLLMEEINAAEDDGEAQQTLTRAYTPGYASPEQLAGEIVGVPSDVFQLGLLIRELALDLARTIGSREGALYDRLPQRLSSAYLGSRRSTRRQRPAHAQWARRARRLLFECRSRRSVRQHAASPGGPAGRTFKASSEGLGASTPTSLGQLHQASSFAPGS